MALAAVKEAGQQPERIISITLSLAYHSPSPAAARARRSVCCSKVAMVLAMHARPAALVLIFARLPLAVFGIADRIGPWRPSMTECRQRNSKKIGTPIGERHGNLARVDRAAQVPCGGVRSSPAKHVAFGRWRGQPGESPSSTSNLGTGGSVTQTARGRMSID